MYKYWRPTQIKTNKFLIISCKNLSKILPFFLDYSYPSIHSTGDKNEKQQDVNFASGSFVLAFQR